MMYITVKGFTGHFLADVVPFNMDNKERLQRIIERIYFNETGERLEGDELRTLGRMKEFVRENLQDMDNYPTGFKHIDGIFCFYEIYG